MKVMKQKHILLIASLVFITLLSIQNIHSLEFPEITTDQLNGILEKLRGEESEKEKAYQKKILEPEKSDLNKDRKISKKELRAAIEWVVYPESEEARQTIDPEIILQLDDGIDLFLKNVPNYLNYRQFQHLLSKIKTEHFIDTERVKRAINNRKQGIDDDEL